ncbi:hypothetical protein J1605_005536 [Eschrichtius robustus]|uniref:Augurin n=1 Tax=Eschrichtius robustus TaxID=9764 RepID=A0AB34H6L6_ESCRO|nr:hypothetical protein J1605_005536 [Eschrichtius robustus]
MPRPLPGRLDLACPSPAVLGGPRTRTPRGLGGAAAGERGAVAWHGRLARDLKAQRPPGGPPSLVPPRLVDPPRAAAAEAPASPSCALRAAMAASSARPAALVMPALALLLLLCVGPGLATPEPGTDGGSPHSTRALQEGCASERHLLPAPAPPTTPVAVPESRAKEFLSGLRRLKRQLWDRTRPEVQQWYQHFLYLGFDEAKFEDDITYRLNRGRNGHDYYDYHQRHHDEDAAIGPWSPYGFRHGASVNYDDY